MSQLWKVGKHKTRIRDEEGYKKVKYWNTDVVAFKTGHIKLKTGGWFTPTTKTRMNQASRQYGLGFDVFQKKHQWYVTHRGKTLRFERDELDLW